MALLLPEKVSAIKRVGAARCRLVFYRQWTLAKWKHQEGRWPRPAPSHVNENDGATSAVWQEEGRVTQCRKVAVEYWVLKDPDKGIQKKPKVLPEMLHLQCVQQTNAFFLKRVLSSQGWAIISVRLSGQPLNNLVAPVNGAKGIYLNFQLLDYSTFHLQVNWNYNHSRPYFCFFFLVKMFE